MRWLKEFLIEAILFIPGLLLSLVIVILLKYAERHPECMADCDS